jgi:hypothetical protein
MHSAACTCVTRYGIYLCERCASVVTSPFCSTLRSDIYHRQGAWPAPYICRRRKASCGLRTVAMSLNAISCCVNVSATSDEMPPAVAGDGARRWFASVLPVPGARICHASARLVIGSTTGHMPPAGVRRFQLNLSASSFSASLAVVRASLPSLGTRCDDAQRPPRLSSASSESSILACYQHPIVAIEPLSLQ